MNGASGRSIMPFDTQLRLGSSAHTISGGSTTSAASSAIAILSATKMPKLRSSGSDENEITATPEIAVMAETMNARPVRRAVMSMASRGSWPRRRSSM